MFSPSFLQELSRSSITDVGEVLQRYIREACRVDMEGAAKSIADAVYEAIPQPENNPRILQLDEYAAEIGDPPPAVAEGLLHQNNLILLAAKPKMHKSFIGVQILDDICRGVPVMGEFNVPASGPVIYLGMEDPPHEIKSRMERRGMLGMGLPFYCLSGQIVLNDIKNIGELEKLIAALNLGVRPACICIDTARHALGIEDWNDAAKVTRVMKPLLGFARKTCLVILIVHNRKADGDGGDTIGGSNALYSGSDGRISVLSKRKLSNDDVQMEIEVETRSTPSFKRMVVMNTSTLIIQTLTDDEATQAQFDAKAEERKGSYIKVVNAVNDAPNSQATVQMVADKMGVQYKWAYTLITELTSQGALKKNGEKITASGTGRPSPLYEITAKGRGSYLFLPLSSLEEETPNGAADDDVEAIND